jgi:hypothetical protein
MDTKNQDIEDLANPGVPFPEVDLSMGMETGQSITEMFNEEVSRVREEAYKWQEWALQEILHWKQRCEELELENMLLQEDFEREREFNMEDIKPKKTGGIFDAH